MTTKNFNTAKDEAQKLHKKYKRTYLICQHTRDQRYEVHSDLHASCWGVACFRNTPVISVIA